MERYDVLVAVGAGTAGSATAIHLARGGARVLLVDKARATAASVASKNASAGLPASPDTRP